jgi:hypothetical protein
MEVPSPCTGVCQLDAARVCIGCGRKIEEIADWPKMGAAQKLRVLARIQKLAGSTTPSRGPSPVLHDRPRTG